MKGKLGAGQTLSFSFPAVLISAQLLGPELEDPEPLVPELGLVEK